MMSEESTKFEWNDPSTVAHDGIVNDAPAIDVSVLTNDSNMFYSNFCVDLTVKMQAASSSHSIPVTWLAFSSSSDMLTSMHNLKMLIESAKSKLVAGLQT